jgi:DinB superfamily
MDRKSLEWQSHVCHARHCGGDPVRKSGRSTRIVVHCGDAEIVDAARLHFLVAEDPPTLSGYDERGWADRMDYLARPLEVALLRVEAVRSSTIDLLRRLTSEAWQRTGTHTTRGTLTLAGWLERDGAHLQEHVDRISRIAEAWKRAKVVDTRSS